MLQRAQPYKEKIQEFIGDLGNEEYLKYYFLSGRHFSDIEIEPDEWTQLFRVSIKDSSVLGFIACNIDRASKRAYGFHAVNMTKAPSPTYSRDVIQFIDDVFNRYGMNKMEFSAAMDNPIVKSYHKFVTKNGGRQVGIFTDGAVTIDGKLTDYAYWEILRRNYSGVLIKK